MAEDLLAGDAGAAQYYDALPYHNFSHAERAAEHGQELVHRCLREGLPVNAQVVHLALLYHDAGYATDPPSVGASTREEYAAAIAAFELTRRGLALAKVAAVTACILATHADARPTTREQQVVRAADLAEIASDWERFLANAEALRAEHELLTGLPVSAGAWRSRVAQVLASYISEDISLTALHDSPEGVSSFHTRALANVARYLAEPFTQDT